MTAPPEPPSGWRRLDAGGCSLFSDGHWEPRLVAAGLDRAAEWERRLRRGSVGSGRGATAVADLPEGGALRLKRLARGGWLAGLRKDRFFGTRRLVDNVSIVRVAIERGVPTPAVVALLVRPGPPGFYRGWLAVEERIGAVDLMRRFRGAAAGPTRGGGNGLEVELEAAMRAVRRMHDAGIEHRDLNLGNLIVRSASPGTVEAWILDLDRARVHRPPLTVRIRQRGLRRLERSVVRTLEASGSSAEWRERLYTLYADESESLGRALAARRRVGRLWVDLRTRGVGAAIRR